MQFFLILSILFLFSNQNKYTENDGNILEEILLANLTSYNASIYCPNNKSKFFNYRERPLNIKVIRNNNKYKSFSSAYIHSKISENEINKFQKSKIFFINKENFDFSKLNNNSNYCFIIYDDYNENKINKSSFINKRIKEYKIYKTIIIISLIFFSIMNIIIFCIFRYFYSIVPLKIEINIISNILHISSIFLSISCILFRLIRLISLIYSIYKSYLIINIIYLLNGYKIFYFQEQRTKRKIMITIIIFATIESITTIAILYIGFSFKDIFYFFCGRNLIEDLIIFVIGIKMFLNNFINLYRQCRLERRARAILILAYKFKLIIYSKVFIFSLLYSLGFFVINIILILFFKFKNDDDYYYNFFEITNIYYMNASIEILFSIIFSIMFFPFNNSLLFFLEFDIKINIYFLTEIKKGKEKNMKINNLNKNILNQKYYSKEYPLIMLEPFTKTNNFLNECHIHLGITKIK